MKQWQCAFSRMERKLKFLCQDFTAMNKIQYRDKSVENGSFNKKKGQHGTRKHTQKETALVCGK